MLFRSEFCISELEATNGNCAPPTGADEDVREPAVWRAFRVLKIFGGFRRKRPTGAVIGKRAEARIGSGASPLALLWLKNGVQTFDEFLDVFELSVDAGESNICDFVDGAELFHNRFAEESGIDFRVELAFYKRFDSSDHFVYLLCRNGAFPAGFLDAGTELGSVVWNADAVPFDDFQSVLFDAFVGRKAPIARQTQSTATNRRSVLSGAGINYLVVISSAKRTSHG